VRLRLASLLVLVLAVAAVAAVAAASNGQPQKKLTPAGSALAQKVALKQSDFAAGWTSKPSSNSKSATPNCPDFKPDQSDLTEIGRFESPEFSGPGGVPFVSSEVAVFKSNGQAKASFDRILKPGLTQCMGSTLEASAPKGMTFKIVSQSLTPVSGLGDQASTGKIVIQFSASGTKGVYDVEFHAIRKGAIDGVIFVVSVGGPYAGTDVLAQKLVSRMP
jgi:hypothetical protein